MQNRPIRVLLIDDAEDDYIAVRNLLSDNASVEFVLKWIPDYGTALDAILSRQFDVCLLDYRLRERNGLELIEEALRRGAMTPIVFLTGQECYDLDIEAMSKGAADWITKAELSAALLDRSIRHAMERQRKSDELLKANRVIQALSECNHAVIHAEDELELLRAICRIVVDVGGYSMAWVGYAEDDPDQTVTPVAKYGYEKGCLETIKVTWQDAWSGKGPAGACIRTGLPGIIRSVGDQAESAPWKEEASMRGYASAIGLPLHLDGGKMGALTIFSSQTDAFDAEEVEFLTKLSGNLSYGIGVLRLRKARMQAEESLKEINLDLESRVEERTAELIKVNAELTREVEERRQAEEALRLSERSLRRAEVVARFGNWAFNLGRDNVEASEGARIIYGLEGGEWSIPGVQKIPLPEYRDMLDKALNELIEEGKPYNVEFKILRPADGKIIDICSKAEYSADKGVVFGVIQDITERKRMEKALLEGEERLRTLINSTPDVVCFKDGEGRWLEANEADLELFELKGVGYQGKKGAELAEFSKFYREALLASETSDELAWEKQAPTRGEEIIPRPNGKAMVYDVIRVPLFHPDGRRKGLVVFGRDVTERKLAEDSLRESEERFSRFFRATPVGASIGRLSNCEFADVNDAFLGLFGYAREEVILHNSSELGMWFDPEDRATMFEILQEKGSIQDFETQLRKKSGEIMDVLISAEVIEVGGLHYLMGLTHDITERKKAKEEKEKLEAQLFQSQKMESVGRLAGGVAHDFNNMLGVIIGRAEMALEQNVPPEKLQRHLKEILKAGLRSADLTRQLLAFARKQAAVPQILDLNGTISGMLKMLRRLIGEDVDLSWQPGLDLWKVKIDPSQVDQILANLVVNARDAISGVGAITMRTENVTVDDFNSAETPEFIPGEYVLLTMSDTGSGMSQEVSERIFEPFFTTKELGKGTGLGLSTVYGVVRQNNGFIYVASEPGKGTTFKIYLPRFEAVTAQVFPGEAAGRQPAGTETILIVEDDEAILNLSKMVLENLGYTVLAAQTPVQAIDLVRQVSGRNSPADHRRSDAGNERPGTGGKAQRHPRGPQVPVYVRLYRRSDSASRHSGRRSEFHQETFRQRGFWSKSPTGVGPLGRYG